MPSPKETTGGSNSAPVSSQQKSTYVSPYDRAGAKSSEHTPHVPFLDRLKALPEIRPIPWRSGQNLPPDKSYDSPRVQQRGASLLATRGVIKTPPCTHCAAGLGRFSVCVNLEGWFQGSCATCVFTSKGNKCSLRADVQNSVKESQASLSTSLIPAGSQEGNTGGVAKKRKRSAPAPKAQLVDNSQYVSPYRSANDPGGSDPAHAPSNPIVPKSPDLDTMLQAEIARGESTGLLEYVQSVKIQKKTRIGKESKATGQNVNGKEPQITSTLGQSKDYPPKPYTGVYDNITNEQSGTPPSAVRPDWAHNIMRDQHRSGTQTIQKNAQPGLTGVIREIQNGINHLQRQLDLLQSMLGLDDGHTVNAMPPRRNP